jgi:hypothetical protein
MAMQCVQIANSDGMTKVLKRPQHERIPDYLRLADAGAPDRGLVERVKGWLGNHYGRVTPPWCGIVVMYPTSCRHAKPHRRPALAQRAGLPKRPSAPPQPRQCGCGPFACAATRIVRLRSADGIGVWPTICGGSSTSPGIICPHGQQHR